MARSGPGRRSRGRPFARIGRRRRGWRPIASPCCSRTTASGPAAPGARRRLLDYVVQEAGGSRVVAGNDDGLAVVPFWASWPYETLLVARSAARRLPDLDEGRRDSLSDIMIRLLRAYDRLLDLSF